MPAGMPSMMPANAGPCDSPAVKYLITTSLHFSEGVAAPRASTYVAPRDPCPLAVARRNFGIYLPSAAPRSRLSALTSTALRAWARAAQQRRRRGPAPISRGVSSTERRESRAAVGKSAPFLAASPPWARACDGGLISRSEQEGRRLSPAAPFFAPPARAFIAAR
jgi:hypothetical protein